MQTANREIVDLITLEDLTERERADFDYVDAESEGGELRLFRYLGAVYDLNEFMRPTDPAVAAEWHGFQADTYFSGVVVKVLCDEFSEGEQIRVARVWS